MAANQEDVTARIHKLLTEGAPCPEWVYVFVRPGHPTATMNLMITGVFSSPVMAAMMEEGFRVAYATGTADFLPFIDNPRASTHFMSPFHWETIVNYRIEEHAERARRSHFPDAPSRLTGIFACETWGDCEAISQKYGWPIDTVQRFKVDRAMRATKVNMEIVSLARLAYRQASMQSDSIEDMWKSYWSGRGDYAVDLPTPDATGRLEVPSGVLWEWIIDGNLIHEDRVPSVT